MLARMTAAVLQDPARRRAADAGDDPLGPLAGVAGFARQGRAGRCLGERGAAAPAADHRAAWPPDARQLRRADLVAAADRQRARRDDGGTQGEPVPALSLPPDAGVGDRPRPLAPAQPDRDDRDVGPAAAGNRERGRAARRDGGRRRTARAQVRVGNRVGLQLSRRARRRVAAKAPVAAPVRRRRRPPCRRTRPRGAGKGARLPAQPPQPHRLPDAVVPGPCAGTRAAAHRGRRQPEPAARSVRSCGAAAPFSCAARSRASRCTRRCFASTCTRCWRRDSRSRTSSRAAAAAAGGRWCREAGCSA